LDSTLAVIKRFFLKVCQEGLTCAPDGVCKEMIPEGYACPEPGADAFCEVRTSCVDGVCTAHDTLALYEAACG
jgi:hypothetical protein